MLKLRLIWVINRNYWSAVAPMYQANEVRQLRPITHKNSMPFVCEEPYISTLMGVKGLVMCKHSYAYN